MKWMKRSISLTYVTPTALLRTVLCATSILLLFSGCSQRAFDLDPVIPVPVSQSASSPFTPLTEEESDTAWGQEFIIGESFLSENDLYRAISSYKRALILKPTESRRVEIEYQLIYTYFLGEKFEEVVKEFEKSALMQVPATFPPFRNLLIMLYESYLATCNVYRARIMETLIKEFDAGLLENLQLSHAVTEGNLPQIKEHLPCHPAVASWYSCYEKKALSPRKAQVLNAILPGMGYYYTGQKKTALTSFLLNGLFIAATVELFRNGYPVAGILTASLEFGWYFGGINGAGLSAKYYNDKLYSSSMQEAMLSENLFPVFMLQKSF